MLEQEEKKEFLDAIQHVISSEVDKLSTRMDGFAIGQDEMKVSIKYLEEGQRELQGSVKSLEEGQYELKGSVKSLEEGQLELRGSVKTLEGSVKSLERGQEEIHEMIQEFSTQVDKRFDSLEGRVGRIESSMVTKDYLDIKLAEHGSRYGEIDRKTNLKIGLLTDSLVAEKSLSSKSAKQVTSAEPFARMK